MSCLPMRSDHVGFMQNLNLEEIGRREHREVAIGSIHSRSEVLSGSIQLSALIILSNQIAFEMWQR